MQTVFDYILIETTGLADPGPVAAALWTDVEIEAGVHAKYCVRDKRDCFESDSINLARCVRELYSATTAGYKSRLSVLF